MISVFPLAIFYGAFFDGIGGVAGGNLISTIEVYIGVFWLGSLSIIFFIVLQYFVFFDAVKFISSFSDKKIQKTNKVP